MSKNLFFKVFCLAAVLTVCLFGVVTTAQASGSIILSQASNVVITFTSEDANCSNTFGVSSPINRTLGTNHGTHEGTQFNIGQIPAGELVLRLEGCGCHLYYTGDVSRNPDRYDHARVTVIGTNQWRIGFEDIYGGGDRDYNDTVLTVTATPVCTDHASKQCVGTTAVYWYNSCGTRQEVYQTCTANQICTNGACVDLPVACSSSFQCGTSGYIGTPTCGANGDVYQTYRTYTCSNPGTPQSVCSQSDILQLKTDCTANQTCTNGSCVNQTITCSTNSQCGTNGYVGSAFCQNDNVYQNYKTYTCNNAGTGNSYCSENTTPQLKVTCTGNQTCSNGSCIEQPVTCNSNSACGTNGYTGSPYCRDGDVYQNYITHTCNNPGTAYSYCSNNSVAQKKTDCTANQVCTNGSCNTQNITCSSNSDCGVNAYTGSPFCQSGNVYQNYKTWTCNNAGTANSYCSESTNSQLKTTCTGNQTCSNGSCGNNCVNHSYQRCQGSYLYWYDSCGNQQESQYCSNGCNYNQCQNQNCTQNSYQRCVGSYLYWYDSCGNQQNNNSQYCQNGCYNNSCQGQYNPYGNCTYHAYKLCVGNNIYWYNSCGGQQDLAQTCAGANMACQYGLCVIKNPVVPTYVAHYNIKCTDDNLFWYDSRGVKNSLYKDCTDQNSCTEDTCGASKCSNTLKCDGSTCAANSPDYNTYCNKNNNEDNNNNNNQNNTGNLSVSFFGKQDSATTQWQKTVQLNTNGTIYFMISVVNNSGVQADNINVSVNIPQEVTSIGNVQVNGVPMTGDIVTGINIGTLAVGTSKSITFEGKAQAFSTQGTKQATASVDGTTDSVSVNLNGQAVAGAAVSGATTGFWAFLKKWYLWILVGLVLLFLFIVVFRRLSSNA